MLDKPFAYNGEDNLMVCVVDNTGGICACCPPILLGGTKPPTLSVAAKPAPRPD